jgi:cyclophilin family peptidyl-prolyl cis-trans isomerase
VDCPPEAGAEEPVQSFSAAPPMCIDPEKSYTAVLKTDAGEITVALDAKRAPKTVNNFVFLARYGFYEGVAFHRVIPTFVIQSGSPSDDPNGGPGYQFEDELPEAGEYELGSVAMANRGPDTNGSQFFIVSGEQGVRGLSPDYSLFGQVTEGMDVVAAIEEDGSGSGLPEQTHTIDEVTITEE